MTREVVHMWLDKASSDLEHGMLRFIADPVVNLKAGECYNMVYHLVSKAEHDRRNS